MRVAGANEAGLKLAVEVLNNAGTLIYPTDTLYGLGASISSEAAVKRTYSLKEMEPAPQSIIMANLEMAGELVRISGLARKFFRLFPVGPFTFLLPLEEEISGTIPSCLVHNGKIGVRIPMHGFPRRLAEITGPITSTSANIHGQPPPKDIKEVYLKGADLYIDDGPCFYGGPSTIITEMGKKLVIVRNGALKRAELERYLGDTIG